MKITITTLGDEIFTLDVSGEMELENFKALCEFECGIAASEIAVVWNGRPLHDDKRSLDNYGIKDGEVLLLQRISGPAGQRSANRPQNSPQQAPTMPTIPGFPQIDFGSIQMPGGAGPSRSPQRPPSSGLPEDPATLRQMLLASPHDVALLKERNPPLAEALLSGSLDKFSEVLRKQQQEKNERERDRIRLLNADPFDPEVQDKIAEEIRLKNVESNMETAMEYAPESFGQVAMLYIDCIVNGHPVKAFVDSGAQMTIMSQNCAERCGIMRLVDRRWAGIAKGVGTQKIIGRVHLCQIKIGPDYLQSSFSILEDQPMDMLLGLDMLKRHQCCLDLRANKLVIGTTGTETPFLSEGDLPEHARLNQQASSEPSMDEDRQLAEALAKSSEESSGSSAGPSGSAPSQTASSPSTPSFPPAHISQLMTHGFSRQQVIEELTRANGNMDQALMALFAKSIQLPK